MGHIELGKYGENAARNYLKTLRYKILCSNYRCPFGEVDIIAMDGNVLVFLEVKTRKSLAFGFGFESVNQKKQRRIRAIALFYLSKNAISYSHIRFDVIDVFICKSASPKIEHIKNAF